MSIQLQAQWPLEPDDKDEDAMMNEYTAGPYQTPRIQGRSLRRSNQSGTQFQGMLDSDWTPWDGTRSNMTYTISTISRFAVSHYAHVLESGIRLASTNTLWCFDHPMRCNKRGTPGKYLVDTPHRPRGMTSVVRQPSRFPPASFRNKSQRATVYQEHRIPCISSDTVDMTLHPASDLKG